MSYNFLFQHLLMPIAEAFSGTSILSKLRYLRRSQRWTKEQLKNYQEAKLKKMIKYAYKRVPYYRKLFDAHGIKPQDIKTNEDLKKIPVLTKKIVRDNFEELKASNYIGKTFIKFTSGSTGTPTQFLRSAEDYSWEWAGHYRAWEWAGYKLGDKYVKISLNNDRNKLNKILQDQLIRCKYLYVYGASNKDLDQYMEEIYNFEPKIIYGYSSSISVLAARMRQIGLKYSAKAVITTGSKLVPSARKIIEERFNTKVFDGYGCGGEGLNIAAECEKGNYHVNDELVYLEVEGKDVIVSSLHNYAMPLLRYKPNDYVTIGKHCACGKNHTILDNIIGRSNEVIRNKKGEIFVVEFIISAFEFVDGIRQYKVIQENIDGIKVQLCVDSRFKKKRDEKKITSFIRKSAGNNFKIKFQYLDEVSFDARKPSIIESKI